MCEYQGGAAQCFNIECSLARHIDGFELSIPFRATIQRPRTAILAPVNTVYWLTNVQTLIRCSSHLAAPCTAQSSSSYFELVDLDRDGRISLAEFQERLSWAFRQMDRNADQVLSPDEQLVANSPTLSLAELQQRLTAQYQRQDRNKDGWLSPREFLAPPA